MNSGIKFLFVLAIGFLSNMTSYGQEISQISIIKAKLMARNGSMMIDVREREEVKELAYDVDGIINIPLSEFADHLNDIPKDKKVILACRSGHRSGKAADILIQNGYSKVYNMEGGMLAWDEKNLGVIRVGKSTKKACCANPNSKKCNPDGTCKKTAKKKSCCSGKKSCKKPK